MATPNSSIAPLNLTEEQYLTAALPGEAPGDVSDAQTAVFQDGDLQTVDDYMRMAADLDQGRMDAAIDREESGLARPAAPQPPVADDAQRSRIDPDDDPDADNVGSTPSINLFGPLGEPQLPAESAPAAAVTPPAPAAPAAPAVTPPADTTPPPAAALSDDPVEAMALSLVAKGRMNGNPVALRRAMEIAEEVLGATKQPDAAETADETIPAGYPTTQAELVRRCRELEAEETRLRSEEYDAEAANKLRDQRWAMQDWFNETMPKIEQAQQQRETAYMDAFNASQGKVLGFYPMAKDAGGDFVRDMAQIDKALQEAGDPRYHDPNKPMLIASWVAQRRNILPMAPSFAQEPPQVPAAGQNRFQAAPIKSPVAPLSGARTSTAGLVAIPPANLDQMSEDEYLRMREAM